MKYDLHVHVNPEERNARNILTGVEIYFLPSIAYNLAKHTFPDWFISNTIGSESIIFPEDIKSYKEQGIIVPSLDHDKTNYEERYKLANEFGIPYGGEFTVLTPKGKSAHIIVMADPKYFKPEDYKKLLENNRWDNFLEIAQKIKPSLLVWAHPYARTNRNGVPGEEELIKQFPGAIEMNSTHRPESFKALEDALKYGKPITVGSDSHNPETIGEAYMTADSFGHLLEDIYNRSANGVIGFDTPYNVAERIERIKNHYVGKISELPVRNPADALIKMLLGLGFNEFLNERIRDGAKAYFDRNEINPEKPEKELINILYDTYGIEVQQSQRDEKINVAPKRIIEKV